MPPKKPAKPSPNPNNPAMGDLNANEPRAGILSEEIAAMHPGERFQLMFNEELEMSEKNELLEAAEMLLGIIDSDPMGVKDEQAKLKQAREIIAKHRPKPERLEGWVNVFEGGRIGDLWSSQEIAAVQADEDCPPIRQALLREVVPVEFERWTSKGKTIFTGDHPMFACDSEFDAKQCVKRHNAELERIANA